MQLPPNAGGRGGSDRGSTREDETDVAIGKALVIDPTAICIGALSESRVDLTPRESRPTIIDGNPSTELEAMMAEPGVLLGCDEAQRLIEQTEDPVTRNLLNMAFVRFVRSQYFEKRAAPSCNVDMLYIMAVLKDYFAEHDVLARTLAGERVGACFDEEP